MNPYNARIQRVLSNAKSLLEDETCWVQGYTAVDARGGVINSGHPQACAWCLTGAIYASVYHLDESAMIEQESLIRIQEAIHVNYPKTRQIRDECMRTDIAAWNDMEHRTLQEVRNVIEYAEAYPN